MAVVDYDDRSDGDAADDADADANESGRTAADVTVPPRLERAIHEFVDEHGRPPLAVEAADRIGRNRTTLSRYGDWSDILAAAGVPTVEEEIERWLLDYLERTYGDVTSLNARQIAADLDMRASAVGQALSQIADESDRVAVRRKRGSRTTRWFISRAPGEAARDGGDDA